MPKNIPESFHRIIQRFRLGEIDFLILKLAEGQQAMKRSEPVQVANHAHLVKT
jgi:hypothetical protein